VLYLTDTFKSAFENNLIDSYEKWVIFHENRNNTSHIYDNDISNEIYGIVEEFLSCAKLLLTNMEIKND
jgi:nucleotidyltransferase substrate binding protein (TIGR01987 family)